MKPPGLFAGRGEGSLLRSRFSLRWTSGHRRRPHSDATDAAGQREERGDHGAEHGRNAASTAAAEERKTDETQHRLAAARYAIQSDLRMSRAELALASAVSESLCLSSFPFSHDWRVAGGDDDDDDNLRVRSVSEAAAEAVSSYPSLPSPPRPPQGSPRQQSMRLEVCRAYLDSRVQSLVACLEGIDTWCARQENDEGGRGRRIITVASAATTTNLQQQAKKKQKPKNTPNGQRNDDRGLLGTDNRAAWLENVCNSDLDWRQWLLRSRLRAVVEREEEERLELEHEDFGERCREGLPSRTESLSNSLHQNTLDLWGPLGLIIDAFVVELEYCGI